MLDKYLFLVKKHDIRKATIDMSLLRTDFPAHENQYYADIVARNVWLLRNVSDTVIISQGLLGYEKMIERMKNSRKRFDLFLVGASGNALKEVRVRNGHKIPGPPVWLHQLTGEAKSQDTEFSTDTFTVSTDLGQGLISVLVHKAMVFADYMDAFGIILHLVKRASVSKIILDFSNAQSDGDDVDELYFSQFLSRHLMKFRHVSIAIIEHGARRAPNIFGYMLMRAGIKVNRFKSLNAGGLNWT